ncbi:MAG: bifunctional (p)ppGpp synthetase/guanosine-3',5'-bis(diphosphate) 3'-pyrophosphohydrolase [Firmicutes bacterium]|nr:bifunctional (p)ppGpp synthetase/guanosine-3',5'-bis(diphosphate) 3'-pyrophosphohydrolase [Bacillota bacterium]
MDELFNFEDFKTLISIYPINEKNMIMKAYELASQLHNGQVRDSGEAYIIHPINVACILAQLGADCDTICAGLLHDTLEDTNLLKEEIKDDFNETVAELVDGVTKIKEDDHLNKKELINANTRKIITSIRSDVRIIIIKLADRLHNMRTLQYKTEIKQKENALETLKLYAPLAYYIGAYRIKSYLEDLSLKYINLEIYESLKEQIEKVDQESKEGLQEMLLKIQYLLDRDCILNDAKIRTKNVYGVYRQIQKDENVRDIYDLHDLHSIKIMVENIPECYLTLGHIHSLYNPLNDKFKDYIFNPKTNMYKSIHTTVFGPNKMLVQAQIRTFEMDAVASFGLTYYWKFGQDDARNVMQEKLRKECKFYSSVNDINSMFSDNDDFVKHFFDETFGEQIYVYDISGNRYELPIGSTPIDFAYKLGDNFGDKIEYAMVNQRRVPIDYELQNNDRVYIVINEKLHGPNEDWLKFIKTTHARKRIKEFNK